MPPCPAPLFAFAGWLDDAIDGFSAWFPAGSFFYYSFNVRALVAVVLVSLICGAVGSLVIGNRMAFFGDALAHCAIAGAAIGVLGGLATNALIDPNSPDSPTEMQWFAEYGIPGIMVLFGIVVGFGIAFVREQTALASDTVIGVFFAGAVGFGGMLFNLIAKYRIFKPEEMLFGHVTTIPASGLLLLLGLVVVEAVLFLALYNQLLLSSFNPVLARSRNVPLRLCNYAFIVLLALVVNLCLRVVGVLLITGMLIVPAATASNLSRNMRQMFWLSILISLTASLVGVWLSFWVKIPVGKGQVTFGSGGVIVVLSVLLFFLSIPVGRKLKSWKFG
jgi:zinc transport system permease protein